MSAAVSSSSPATTPMQFAQPRSFINLNHPDPRSSAPPVSKQQQQQQQSPIEPPPGMSYAEFLRSWSDAHVARWLVEIKCGNHDESFKANDIRGDILLDLDQETLREIGVASIGDRLRILNAVKILRQRVAGKPAPPQRASQRFDLDNNSSATGNKDSSKPVSRRLDTMRPTPLPLSNRSELPDIVPQQGPDSAKSIAPLVRPLPQPTQSSTPPSGSQLNTPNTAHSIISSHPRPSKLPALPPPPKGQPPLPPGRARNLPPWPKVEPPAYTNQPPPPPPQNQPQLTPGGNRQLLPDPRSSNSSTITRSISPTPQLRPRANPSTPIHHGRNGSLSSATNTYSPNKPSNRPTHPYANAQLSVNGPPNNPAHTLSPIDESFVHQSSSSTPPGGAYTVGRGPFNPSGNSSSPYTVDDFRRKFVKVVVPDEGHSFTLDVAACNGGVEVLEKVLKKFGKTTKNEGNLEVTQADEGGLVVDGWGIFMDMGTDGNPGQPLTEAELLSICHAPDHPTRETGLVLRRVQSAASVRKNIKRASTISVLSGLGVRYPDQTLAPPSPTQPAAKRPSKLRNFFGQRPPSELITTHLTEFFPNAEKKVLARTARNSMMIRSGTTASRRESNASFNQHIASRFSSSTQGSAVGRRSFSPSRASISTVPPPVPEKPSSSGSPFDTSPTEDLPRVSLSTEDGRSVDLHIDGGYSGHSVRSGRRKSNHPHSSKQLHHLPPIPFPSEPFSVDDGVGGGEGVPRASRRMSRAMSIASKRASYMTELRSKRDKSDTASVMTVDQITANVESRRESKVDLDGWTKVGNEIETMVPQAVASDEVGMEDDDDIIASDSEDELSESGDEDEDEDETLREDEDELALDVDDDGVIRDVSSGKAKKAKWIKGALIGAGSFGKVYLGMDAATGFLMAVKQVELPKGTGPNQERKKSMLSALEREIELLKNLEHENIVQYLYSAIEDEYLNIFLEYVPGGSVTALLQNYGAFEEVLVKNFVRQILQGLNYLHERDIIHRDIKGANILVDNRGGIKISDFGISKKVDDNLLTGNRMNRPSLQGSVFWMAPEVVKQTGHTRKADIWSVGCLVVEMLTGEHPWAQLTQMQAIFKIGSSAKPTIPSDISADAQDFLQRTFEIDHEARPTAAELLQHPWIANVGNAVLKPGGA